MKTIKYIVFGMLIGGGLASQEAMANSCYSDSDCGPTNQCQYNPFMGKKVCIYTGNNPSYRGPSYNNSGSTNSGNTRNQGLPEVMAACAQTRTGRWHCDGKNQKTSTSHRDINEALDLVECDHPRKQVEYQGGYVFFCGEPLSPGSMSKDSWNRDINKWWNFPDYIISQRRFYQD